MACWLGAAPVDRVEEQAVELLEHREHGFAGDRGPTAEHHRDLLLFEQLAGLFGEQGPVGGRVHDDRFQLLAQHTAFLVLLVDEHQHGVLQGGFADGHGPRQRVEDTDLDGVRRRQGTGQTESDRSTQADERSSDEAAFSHGIYS